ncbi:hypothetical protein FQN52_002258 [Onygenales sp. PD_12]|nr:hypothetical protein FQN52_002258 [Onygenales sp. PD_12]
MSSLVNGFASSSEKRRRTPPILRLPPETLNAIFSYASSADLVNLALVSKAFHHLAAAQLYRSLSHVFTEDDTRTGHLAVDRLAGILDTLTTSDYNYATYIKEISLDTLHGGDAGERAAQEFKYEYSCGKFLNTLFLATIKKISALETFRWNVRVEISPAVFTALSNFPSLQHAHVRMQAGPSLHSAATSSSSTGPPPPPLTTVSIPPPSTSHHAHHHHHHHHHPPPPPPGPMPSYMVHTKSVFGDARPVKRLDVHKTTHSPRNFSRFSNLRSLAVLDMDTLEYIPEIAVCISSSATTLKNLKLSFSETLALKARKKTVTDVSDTETAPDDDDEGFQNDIMPLSPPVPLPPGMSQSLFGNTTTSNNDADVRRERGIQEKTLARIFGLEKDTPVQKRLEQVAEEAISAADKEILAELRTSSKEDVDRLFVEKLYSAVRDVSQNKSKYPSSSKGAKALEKIEKAAAKYLERNENADSYQKEKKKSFPSQKPPAKLPPLPKPGPVFSTGLTAPTFDYYGDSTPPEFPTMVFPSSSSHHPSSAKKSHAFMSKHTPVTYTAASSYMPKYNGTGPPLGTFKAKPNSGWKASGKAVINNSSSTSETGEMPLNNIQPANPQEMEQPAPPAEEKKSDDEFLDVVDMEHPEEASDSGEDQEFLDPTESSTDDEVPFADSGEEPGSGRSNGLFYDIGIDAGPSHKGKGKEPARDPSPMDMTRIESPTENYEDEDAIQEYIRLHHGIPLESISIHLIPVKPSVLCRAINICSLRHISLLNVGPQRPFWAMLSKLNQTTPLKLTSIHTDNVTPALLTFLNGLRCVEDLFMVERSSRSKVEPFASKTMVVIEDIRTLVLMKHMKHLRRLMIRNDDDNSWTLNKESVKLLARHGSQLKELVISLGSTNFHLLMQRLSGMRSLEVLHILFQQTDYCPSVLREVKSCAIDSVIQRPSLRVKYIAVTYGSSGSANTHVSMLTRTPPLKKPSAGKGKGKAVENLDSPAPGSAGKQCPWPTDDSDDDGFDFDREGRVVVSEGIKIRDVVDIKIWQKEIWDLRL